MLAAFELITMSALPTILIYCVATPQSAKGGYHPHYGWISSAFADIIAKGQAEFSACPLFK
jgi:hypothetical protein